MALPLDPAHRDALTRRSFVTIGALGTMALAACSANNTASETQATETTASASASPSPTPTFGGTINVVPALDQVEINPLETVTVSTEDSKLTKVTVTTEKGEELPGELAADGKSWASTDRMVFNRTYTVAWEADDAEGISGKGKSTFATVSAPYEADARINIVDGETVGIGRIIQLNFSEPVINKAEVEERIKITGGGDHPGKFRWYNDQMVRYRPEKKWDTNSTITIELDIFGLDIGNGMIGNHELKRTFHTWNKRYALADNNTKTIKMWVDDKLIHEAPITLGNTDWPSVVGELVIIEKAESYFFNPGSLDLAEGDPHYYEPFWASWTSRLTSSGVFVHQALPSAWPSVGYANLSHGCIGMLPEDVKIFYNNFGVGDVVETINTGYPQADPDDGYGDWNIPFENYSDASWKGNW
ncbi:L,D-transpeptidase [Rothia nasimurium]|uniref:L,D-transpeptidase n=1 Tax=Rothia nasimurium TaxID=85336 RepID=UPI001F2DF509|nr:Ig-like domain-containing protein [Rothia nasimurium]